MKPKPIVTVSHRCSLAKPLNSEQARNASSKFQSRKKKTDEKLSAHSQRQHQKQEKKKKYIYKQSWSGQQKCPT